jgi:hypothetical protein
LPRSHKRRGSGWYRKGVSDGQRNVDSSRRRYSRGRGSIHYYLAS